MSYQEINFERIDGVGVITLNRPQVLNALSRNLRRELDGAVTECEEDPGVKAVLITGAGEQAFSAGADIHESARLVGKSGREPADQESTSTETSAQVRSRVYWHVAVCRKPTIGAINGLAYGAAAVIASSLDIRVGCERSSFRFLAASYGRINSTWSLPLQVGWPMAKELLFTARVVEAEEAYRIGLLNHLVPSEKLMDKAFELGKLIAANDSRMVQGIKSLLLQNVGENWLEMYGNEVRALAGDLRPTPFLEAFKSFLEKKRRQP